MDSHKLYNLILASQSPRRKELLGWLDIPFTIMPSNIEEKTNFTKPVDVVNDIGKIKGFNIWDKLKKKSDFGKTFFPFVVSSDTIVTLDGKIYGKPKNLKESKKILLELSGRTHSVLTSVAIICHDLKTMEIKTHTFLQETQVTFSIIGEDFLDSYVQSEDGMDKAGSYGIQGKGLTFISKVDGSYSNVVGFPLNMFIDELRIFLNDQGSTGEWRNCFQQDH